MAYYLKLYFATLVAFFAIEFNPAGFTSDMVQMTDENYGLFERAEIEGAAEMLKDNLGEELKEAQAKARAEARAAKKRR